MINDRLSTETGFSLTELVIVVAILGILAATVIPQVSAYRKRGYEGVVKSDITNAVTAQEAYFTKMLSYKAGALSSGTPPGFYKSADVTVSSTVATSAFVFVGFPYRVRR